MRTRRAANLLTVTAFGVVFALGLMPQTATAGPVTPSSPACGDTISTNLKLAVNMLCDSVANGLVVGADNITIDLNGKTLTMARGSSNDGNIDVGGHTGVKIINGSLVVAADGRGVWVDGGSVTVSAVTLTSSATGTLGISCQAGAVVGVQGVTITGLQEGIYANTCAKLTVSSSNLSGNDDGIDAENVDQTSISGVTANYNTYWGVLVYNGAVSIANTTANYNGYGGFRLDAHENGVVNASDSFARFNHGPGFDVLANYKLGTALKTSMVRNTSTNNDGPGFQLYRPGAMQFTSNTANYNGVATASGADGVTVTDLTNSATFVGSRNAANFNDGYGLTSTGTVTGTGNTATGNILGKCSNWTCR